MTSTTEDWLGGKDFCEHKSLLILVLYGSSYFWDLKAWKSTLIRGPARVNSDKRHGPKIRDSTTKMKSRQETTSLGQIVTVTEKPTISDKHFMNTDTRRFKIQTGDMGAPPGRASNKLILIVLSIPSRIIFVQDSINKFFSWTESWSCDHTTSSFAKGLSPL